MNTGIDFYKEDMKTKKPTRRRSKKVTPNFSPKFEVRDLPNDVAAEFLVDIPPARQAKYEEDRTKRLLNMDYETAEALGDCQKMFRINYDELVKTLVEQVKQQNDQHQAETSKAAASQSLTMQEQASVALKALRSILNHFMDEFHTLQGKQVINIMLDIENLQTLLPPEVT